MAASRLLSSARFLKGIIIPHFNSSRGFSSTLFVKGISFSSTEDRLAEAFSKHGEVLEAKIIMNKTGDRPKGYGYVTFAKEDDAKKALMAMNGKVLHGRVIFVDNVQPRRRSSQSP